MMFLSNVQIKQKKQTSQPGKLWQIIFVRIFQASLIQLIQVQTQVVVSYRWPNLRIMTMLLHQNSVQNQMQNLGNNRNQQVRLFFQLAHRHPNLRKRKFSIRFLYANNIILHTDQMQQTFQQLFPQQYYQKFADSKVRPDGRSLGECRQVSIAVGVISTADSSALVRIGKTSVLAGVKLELGVPDVKENNKGRFKLGLEFSKLCQAQDKQAQITKEKLKSVLVREDWLDLTQLCIDISYAAWDLILDAYVIDNDGSVFDAALLACVAAIKTLKIPQVNFHGAGQIELQEQQERKILEIGYIPIGLTCGLFQDNLVADPTLYEEKFLEQVVNLAMDEDKNILGIFMEGGSCLLDVRNFNFCIQLLETRYAEVVKVLQQSLMFEIQ
eukprot:TRINITY_DN8280_c0_g3_i1.p1 TRINITY_DN8280_c0_g3~~TRINITY_DN8280_c0_g3_i1.p1  ORF type:complete len:384 (+),score=12.09 TRINITY_DN8280_c0_g3_i1:363-1514(+)